MGMGSAYIQDDHTLRVREKAIKIVQERKYEEYIRERNPAVKDAWEHYQVLLRLASNK